MPVTRRTLLKTAAAAAATSLAAGPLAVLAQAPLKVGFVYVSPVGDAGWTFQHDQGRKQMEKVLGAKVTTKFVESVPEGADAERVIRELASSGHALIFTTSFGYMNPTVKVAQSFPKTHFEHATGYKTAKNVGIYNARFYEGRYLAGVIAGRMTKSNTLGYVGAFPIPEVLQGMNAFMRGARSVNPKAEMKVIWVNSWYDPGREREAAMTLISQGADVVTHHTDSTATVQAAEEKGVYAMGYHSDMSKYGPKAHLTAVTHHWGDFYTRAAQDTIAGKMQPSNLWGGMKQGMIKLAPINAAVPADVKTAVAALEKDIIAGKFHPFTGPVKDQSGKERVAVGVVMTDKELGGMDFYVEGIQGQLPRKQ
jgi:simple sugar transport system substrate-binding protein